MVEKEHKNLWNKALFGLDQYYVSVFSEMAVIY